MRKRYAIAMLVLLVLGSALSGQQTGGTQTAQQASHYDAAVTCNSLDAASGSATLTPQSGMSEYITSIDINVGATGTVTAAAPVKATSTGLSGTPTFGLFRSDGMTIGQVGAPVVLMFPNGLKGQLNTAVAITGAAVTNLVWHITVCGYQSP